MTLTGRDIYLLHTDKLVQHSRVFMEFLLMDCSIKMEWLVTDALTGQVNVVIYNVYTHTIQLDQTQMEMYILTKIL